MTPCVQEPPRRRFTLRTETVAEYAREDVSGWCLDDADA